MKPIMPIKTRPTTGPIPTLSGKRALICDDEGMILMAVSRALKDGGLSVIGVDNNSEDAVDIALREGPDLILLDMRMPGMNGLEAAGHILNVYRPCVVMLTASEEIEYQEQAHKIGVCGYLIKPISANTLMRQLRLVWEAFSA